jgi:mRNA interferase RelE/StbE
MSYSVSILRRAQKERASLPREEYGRVRERLIALADDPRPPGCAKLTGRAGWRVRVGDYRVLYDIDDAAKAVTVVHVGHRSDVYR